jgi:hypothetical protein
MKQVWILLVVAACEHGQTPGIAARNPSLRVTDVQVPVDPLSPSGASHLVFRLELSDDICSPLPPDTVATVAGTPMTLVVDEFGGSCTNIFEVDVGAVTAGDDTVEVHDDSGAASATLDPGLLAPRSMTAASFDIKNGQPFTITWSHPEDIADLNFSPFLSFRQVFVGPCESGCFGEQFSTFGQSTTATTITFTPSFGSNIADGEIVVQSSRIQGSISSCNARQCSFDLSHSAVHSASASL